MIRILFVCLGNICRSPLAQGVMQHLVAEAGLQHRFHIDSAGTSNYEVGNPPDPRTRANAASHGIALQHSARQPQASDAAAFDHIIVMDRNNLRDVQQLLARHGQPSHHVQLLRHWDHSPGDGQVADPYYGGPEGFEEVYQQVDRSCRGLLAALAKTA